MSRKPPKGGTTNRQLSPDGALVHFPVSGTEFPCGETCHPIVFVSLYGEVGTQQFGGKPRPCDVVRLQSQGYSRVVILTRQPMTFAIPAAASGVVNIAGMRDGEGGGITVGVASGASRVTLPIMSVGQTIGLRTQAP